MGSLYVLILGVAVYSLVVRAASGRDIHPIISAIVVVTLPLVLEKIMWYIYLSSNELPLWQLISLSDAMVVLAQLGFAAFVFYKLQRNQEAVGRWLFWVLVGLVGIYFIVPYLVRLVVPY